ELIHWQGQASRLSPCLNSFQQLVDDFERGLTEPATEPRLLDAYLGYPNAANPRAVLFLARQTVPNSQITFAAIERSPGGIVRFQLAGEEFDAWVERHPAGSLPASFEGGLGTQHTLLRYKQLDPHWHLTRYRLDYPLPPARPRESSS